MNTWGKAVLVLLISLPACTSQPDPTLDFRSGMREEVLDLGDAPLPLGRDFPPHVEAYVHHWKFRDLDLDPSSVRLALRLVPWEKGDIFSLALLPPGPPAGTLFVLHGYLASLGNFAGIMRVMVEQRWAAVAMDLPGHGLSSGYRADIEDFGDYALAVRAWLEALGGLELGRPWVALGHSTGASALVEYTRRWTLPWDALILSAPLIRHAWWEIAQPLAWLNQLWLKDLPPLVSPDPLVGIHRVPLTWVIALGRWERELVLPPRPEVVVLFHQDRSDNVVDWRHNLQRLSLAFPHNRVIWQEGMGHVTLADFHRYREVFQPLLEWMLDHLGSPVP